MSIYDEWPAFPTKHWNGWREPHNGMTLRDYFAAKAMAAFVAAYPCQAIDEADGGHQIDFDAVADDAYKLADAMLAARPQREDGGSHD